MIADISIFKWTL